MIYKIVEAFEPYAGAALANKVNEHIKEGWQLHGNICAVNANNKVKLYQTMVKEDNNDMP